MRALVCSVCLLLLLLTGPSVAKESAPKVQVYTRAPGEYGKDNTLICHVSGFHPPEITIELLRNGKEIPEAKQTDLAFEENWHYHMTKHVPFTPNKGDEFGCRVTHLGKKNAYAWEPDM
ncbi:beta-2-microglobulin-like [Archocentrus centrarchus]|uniref:beta-2-microglobulin-like n=1 Tax=Archocentrus centrarchus TaxID=63155 RepID=UPI0011EA3348|nr:beta-2-microglobulin-like [Archocentrus centrarchus]XP_030575662.1 beta-2-microglobulin-like [Archocentrus centrarchus]